jgi:hypothetical protein
MHNDNLSYADFCKNPGLKPPVIIRARHEFAGIMGAAALWNP